MSFRKVGHVLVRLSAPVSVYNRRRSNEPVEEALMNAGQLISFVLIGLMLLSSVADVVEGMAIKRAGRVQSG
jgi:hypothetical protein